MGEIKCCGECYVGLQALGAASVLGIREISLGHICDAHLELELQKPYPGASLVVDATREQLHKWKELAPRRAAPPPVSDAEGVVIANLAIHLLKDDLPTDATIAGAVEVARRVYDAARGRPL